MNKFFPSEINCFEVYSIIENMIINKKQSSNYDYFIKTNTSEYKGEWVAISKGKVVSHGKDAQVVYNKAREHKPHSDISLAKVPEQELLVLKFTK